MHRFYADNLNLESQTAILNEVESNHACKVLRLNEGEALEIINGQGLVAQALITKSHHKRCEVKIERIQSFEAPKRLIHLAICPTKGNDRFEWMLEKIVEIGVDEITPLISENSERNKLNFERLEKIILSATKQSLRAYMPMLNPQFKVSEFIENQTNTFMAHCDEGFERVSIQGLHIDQNVTIMIGPEGDFSKREIELALQNGLKSVSLGQNRLRTETAGVVAVALLRNS
jgi:16S rRNA (uracil1498-N3)-methyltransferase